MQCTSSSQHLLGGEAGNFYGKRGLKSETTLKTWDSESEQVLGFSKVWSKEMVWCKIKTIYTTIQKFGDYMNNFIQHGLSIDQKEQFIMSQNISISNKCCSFEHLLIIESWKNELQVPQKY